MGSMRFMSVRDVVSEANIGKTKAYELMHELGAISIDGCFRLSRRAFEEYIKSQEETKWQTSTFEARSTGVGSKMRLASGFENRRGAGTRSPRDSRSDGSNACTQIRPITPRTRPRLQTH